MCMSSKTAKEIREALKAAGFGRALVSVRNDSYSMGSTVHVKVRRADIALDAIEAIARPHEIVRRDEQGDILGGGNTHIDVEYETGALDAATVTIREMIGAGVCKFGKLELLEDRADPDRLDVFSAGTDGAHVARLYREFAAEGLTRILAARGELAAARNNRHLACANDVELAPEQAPAPEVAPAPAAQPEAAQAPARAELAAQLAAM
jgi:hypothetical protein